MPRELSLELPRAARLRRRQQFLKVYDRGVRAPGQYMVVFALPRDSGGSRIGVTASRRVGGAVVRARCKRRLRELFRHHQPALKGVSLDVVLNARAGCAEARWDELQEEFHRCMSTVRERLAGV